MRPALTIEANQPSNNQTIDQSDNHTYNQAVSQSQNATISAASVSSKAKANKRPNDNAQLPWHAQVGKRVRTEPTVLNRVTVLDESRRETPIDQSLHYLHVLARDPTMVPYQDENRFFAEILSYRSLPTALESRQKMAELGQQRVKNHVVQKVSNNQTINNQSITNQSVSHSISQSAIKQVLSQAFVKGPLDSYIPMPLPAELTVMQNAPPMTVITSSPSDWLIVKPAALKRRKAVDRCTSPSHFVDSRFNHSLQGTINQSADQSISSTNDWMIDCPTRERMDNILYSTSLSFYPARLIANEDPLKVWTEQDAGRKFYQSIDRVTLPIRRIRSIERWSIRQIALFEAGICRFGKNFHEIARCIEGKSTNECVEFYYSSWKHSDHYDKWKYHSHNQSINQSINQSNNQMSSWPMEYVTKALTSGISEPAVAADNQSNNQTNKQSNNQPVVAQVRQAKPVGRPKKIRPPVAAVVTVPVSIHNVNQSINQSNNQSINQSIHQPMTSPKPVLSLASVQEMNRNRGNQPINQSIHQSNNQSNNQSPRAPAAAILSLRSIENAMNSSNPNQRSSVR